jgi:Tfp pilus assembly PilM family ATPase
MPNSQSTSSSIIGLSLADSEAQAVDLSLTRSLPTINAIAEWAGGLQEEPAVIADRLAAFIATNGLATHRIAVTLDTGFLFTHVLPVPADQADALLHKHALWDLAQFFPDAAESEFITDVHLLQQPVTGDAHRLLSVSVRRAFARALGDALAAKDLSLSVLDGDHFSAEQYLASRHPDGRAGLVALVGLKRERMDVSFLLEGALLDYRSRGEWTPEVFTEVLAEGSALCGQPRKLYLYGSRATTEMVDSLRAAAPAPVEVLNPFAGMELRPGNSLAKHFLAMPQRFVPAVGAALREE